MTLLEGMDELQFSWVNRLIDPISLEMLPQKNTGSIDIFDLTFLLWVRNLGLWNIKSGMSGKVPVEISYLTSGLLWRGLREHAGELIVGKVPLIDQITRQ